MSVLDTVVKPGDIVLTASNSFLARAIRWCERSPKEAKSLYNHTGLIGNGGTLRDCTIIEALWRTEEHSLLKEYGGKSDIVAIFRRIDIGASETAKVVARARTYLGKKYGWWKIPAHGIDALVSRAIGKRVSPLKHILWIESRPICSLVVADAYDELDIRFCGTSPTECQPDDIADTVVSSALYTVVVRATKIPKR